MKRLALNNLLESNRRRTSPLSAGEEFRRVEVHEREFITSRGGFIALEMIHDTVKAVEKDELETYLNSEWHQKK